MKEKSTSYWIMAAFVPVVRVTLERKEDSSVSRRMCNPGYLGTFKGEKGRTVIADFTLTAVSVSATLPPEPQGIPEVAVEMWMVEISLPDEHDSSHPAPPQVVGGSVPAVASSGQRFSLGSSAPQLIYDVMAFHGSGGRVTPAPASVLTTCPEAWPFPPQLVRQDGVQRTRLFKDPAMRLTLLLLPLETPPSSSGEGGKSRYRLSVKLSEMNAKISDLWSTALGKVTEMLYPRDDLDGEVQSPADDESKEKLSEMPPWPEYLAHRIIGLDDAFKELSKQVECVSRHAAALTELGQQGAFKGRSTELEVDDFEVGLGSVLSSTTAELGLASRQLSESKRALEATFDALEKLRSPKIQQQQQDPQQKHVGEVELEGMKTGGDLSRKDAVEYVVGVERMFDPDPKCVAELCWYKSAFTEYASRHAQQLQAYLDWLETRSQEELKAQLQRYEARLVAEQEERQTLATTLHTTILQLQEENDRLRGKSSDRPKGSRDQPPPQVSSALDFMTSHRDSSEEFIRAGAPPILSESEPFLI